MLLLKVIIVILIFILLSMFRHKEPFDSDDINIKLTSLYDGDVVKLFWHQEDTNETTNIDGFNISVTNKNDETKNKSYMVNSDEQTKFYIKTIIIDEDSTILISNSSGKSELIDFKKINLANYDKKKHIDHKIQCYPDGSYGTVLDCLKNYKFPTTKKAGIFYELKKIVNSIFRKNIILQ